jgi:hypothetical protein
LWIHGGVLFIRLAWLPSRTWLPFNWSAAQDANWAEVPILHRVESREHLLSKSMIAIFLPVLYLIPWIEIQSWNATEPQKYMYIIITKSICEKSKISEYQIYQFSDMPDKKISHNFTQFNTAWQIDMNKSMSLLMTKLQEQKTCYVIISAFWLLLHWHSHKIDITKFKIEILTAARDACILSPEIGLVERLVLHKRVAPVINWNLQMRWIKRI